MSKATVKLLNCLQDGNGPQSPGIPELSLMLEWDFHDADDFETFLLL